MTDFVAPRALPSRDDWEAAVARDLKGRDYDRALMTTMREGIRIGPLYTAADAPVGTQLGRTSERWAVVQRVESADVEDCRAHIEDDMAHGCDGVHLRLDRAGRLGSAQQEHVGDNGAAIATGYELARALGEFPMETGALYLDAGANGLAAWGLWRAVAARARVAPAALRGGLLHDVSEASLSDGVLPAAPSTLWDDAAAICRACASQAPQVRALAVSSVGVHEAGADAVLELGVLTASLVQTLRELNHRGVSAAEAAEQLIARMAIGTDLFLEMAKLRAAHWLLARVLETCGAPGTPLPVHASGSSRSLARIDEPVNMLRGSTQALAAVAGGADIITTLPHDVTAMTPSRLARRVARNAQLILRDESHAHVVRDPASGSWTVEHLTEQLATRGWECMQEIERRGGLSACIADGWLHERVGASWAKRERELRRADAALVGVSAFPPAEAEMPVAAADRSAALRAVAKRGDAAGSEIAAALEALGSVPSDLERVVSALVAGATLAAVHAGQHRRAVRVCDRLSPQRDAAMFEALRMQTPRPALLLFAADEATVSARASWTRNLLCAGGFSVSAIEHALDSEVSLGDLSGTVAVVCLSDSDFGAHLSALVEKASSSGALVAAAGHPKNAPAVSRVHRWLHIGIDIPETLEALHLTTEAP